jgi:hypothetical protein
MGRWGRGQLAVALVAVLNAGGCGEDTAEREACDLEITGFPVDETRGCVDTSSPESLGCVWDPRDENRQFRDVGSYAVSDCAKRRADGKMFSSPVPVGALDSEVYEECDPTTATRVSCEVVDCPANEVHGLAVMCSARDFCGLGAGDGGVLSFCGADKAVDERGCVRTQCTKDEDCGVGQRCGEFEIGTAANWQCAYTPEGECTCAGLGDGPLARWCFPG